MKVQPIHISDATYFAADGLNSSILKQFAVSPAHCKAYVDNPTKSSKAFDVGRMTHGIILQDERSWKVVVGDRRKKVVKEEVAEAQGDGFVVISQDDEDAILGMNLTVRCHEDAKVIASNPDRAELALMVECPITGLKLKAKYDWLPEFGSKIFDLKTCQHATPRKFAYAVKDFGYLIQALHYRYCAQLAGLPKKDFIFVAVEKTAPYGAMCYELDEEFLDSKMPWYMSLLAGYSDCVEDDNFSRCYPTGIHKLEL